MEEELSLEGLGVLGRPLRPVWGVDTDSPQLEDGAGTARSTARPNYPDGGLRRSMRYESPPSAERPRLHESSACIHETEP